MNKIAERFEFSTSERIPGLARPHTGNRSAVTHQRSVRIPVGGPDPEPDEIGNGLPVWKRILDFAMIVAMAPALLLIGIFVALLVKFSSTGPVLFKQRRIGYKGRSFLCYKFRTMQVNAETQTHQNHTQDLIKSQAPMIKLDSKKDPRLTPFGAVLRATGLDELPQLLNVLRGEMSIVGPRPCVLYEYELYGQRERRRFEATPGLTGLWQVSGKNRTTFNEMIDLDIKYAETKSLWLDVAIICRTLPALWVQCMDTAESRRQHNPPSNRLPKSIQFNNL